MGIHCATCTCKQPELDELPWREQPLMVLSPAKSVCPAYYTVGSEGGDDNALTCLIEGHHDGDHETWFNYPCTSCYGFEQHTEWCPDMESTTSGGFKVKFSGETSQDVPWYWVEVER